MERLHSFQTDSLTSGTGLENQESYPRKKNGKLITSILVYRVYKDATCAAEESSYAAGGAQGQYYGSGTTGYSNEYNLIFVGLHPKCLSFHAMGNVSWSVVVVSFNNSFRVGRSLLV